MGTPTAFVIHPDVRTMPLPRSADAMLEEAAQLAGAIGLEVIHAKRWHSTSRAGTFLGSGVVDRLAAMAGHAER